MGGKGGKNSKQERDRATVKSKKEMNEKDEEMGRGGKGMDWEREADCESKAKQRQTRQGNRAMSKAENLCLLRFQELRFWHRCCSPLHVQ